MLKKFWFAMACVAVVFLILIQITSCISCYQHGGVMGRDGICFDRSIIR